MPSFPIKTIRGRIILATAVLTLMAALGQGTLSNAVFVGVSGQERALAATEAVGAILASLDRRLQALARIAAADPRVAEAVAHRDAAAAAGAADAVLRDLQAFDPVVSRVDVAFPGRELPADDGAPRSQAGVGAGTVAISIDPAGIAREAAAVTHVDVAITLHGRPVAASSTTATATAPADASAAVLALPGSKAELRLLAPAFALSDLNGRIILLSIAITGLLIIVGLPVAFLTARSIASPVERLTGVLRTLAQGDVDVTVEGTERADEIGAMARAIESFHLSLLSLRQLETERAERESLALRERQLTMQTIANVFANSVEASVETVATEAARLRGTTGDMADLARQASTMSSRVAESVDTAVEGVQDVAKRAELVATTVTDTGNRIKEVARAASNAADEASRADKVIGELAQAASAIGQIVDLIQRIAKQTDLLALNASIEAARAGTAGLGFTVVANEVKVLSRRTGDATADIARQVTTIRAAIADATAAIAAIGSRSATVDSASSVVAETVERQSIMVREMSDGATRAAEAVNRIADVIREIAIAATCAGASAAEGSAAAAEMADLAGTMRARVDEFVGVIASLGGTDDPASAGNTVGGDHNDDDDVMLF